MKVRITWDVEYEKGSPIVHTVIGNTSLPTLASSCQRLEHAAARDRIAVKNQRRQPTREKVNNQYWHGRCETNALLILVEGIARDWWSVHWAILSVARRRRRIRRSGTSLRGKTKSISSIASSVAVFLLAESSAIARTRSVKVGSCTCCTSRISAPSRSFCGHCSSNEQCWDTDASDDDEFYATFGQFQTVTRTESIEIHQPITFQSEQTRSERRYAIGRRTISVANSRAKGRKVVEPVHFEFAHVVAGTYLW